MNASPTDSYRGALAHLKMTKEKNKEEGLDERKKKKIKKDKQEE